MSDFPSRIACIPSNDVINRWKNQLAKASDPDEQKRLTEMITEAEAGSVLNSANAGLESAEKLDGWNTQRAQIQVSMGAAKDNFERVKARLEKLPGADKETINRSIFNASS
ncbi:hypothetical protein KKA47_02305, partial [bacterium]|nr:hypothetical protein [bacterium]